MAYDLIVMTLPAVKSCRAIASTVTEDIRRLKALTYCEIGEGPTEPNAVDAISLDDCLAAGECSEDNFAAFCRANELPTSVGNQESAAAFLDSLWGLTLTFVKLPREYGLVRAAYVELIAFAKAKGFRIKDPQLGRDIDLSDPGEVPPKWT